MITLKRVENLIQYSGPTEEIQILQSCLSIFNPACEYTVSYQKGHWDGFERFYISKARTFYLGLHRLVVEKLTAAGIVVEDKVEYYIDIDRSSIQYPEKLWQHQKEALDAFFEFKCGIVKVTTRGGKTLIACLAMLNLLKQNPGMSVLFVVDSTDLYKQTLKDFNKFFEDTNYTIGEIRGQIFEPGDITVATIQTLGGYFSTKKSNAAKRKKASQFLDTIKFLVVDEIHEFYSDKRVEVLRKCVNVESVLGLSATPFKTSPLHEMTIRSLFGNIIYETIEEELRESKVLSESQTFLIICTQLYKKWQSYDEVTSRYITYSEKRNGLIVYLIQLCEKLGLKTIVFFHLNEHGREISEATGITYISGKSDEEERLHQKEELLEKEGGVLLVSSIWKKGITLPEVEVCINAGGGKEATLIIQKRGRILGRIEGDKEKSLMIDFIDDQTQQRGNLIKGPEEKSKTAKRFYLDEHSYQRMLTYEQLNGTENIKVFDSDDSKFEASFEQAVKDWF